MSKTVSLNRIKDTLVSNNTIPSETYNKLDVKRGLRNKDGSGVLAGLTRISSVRGSSKVDAHLEPVEGELKLRGQLISDLLNSFDNNSRFCFERIAFLLLVGSLPNEQEFNDFCSLIDNERELPPELFEHCIKGIPSPNIMNKIQSAVTCLYGFDTDNPDSIDPYDNFIKSIKLMAKLPAIIAYSYLATHVEEPVFVDIPKGKSQAETFLYLLEQGKEPDNEKAHMLDLALVLHAEHGGGNCSTFTASVVSSSHSDLYSSIAAAVGSLKGPLHGSANKKVMDMMQDIKTHVNDWSNAEEVCQYLRKILDKDAHDRSGKIYGLGHAVYTKSDPRAIILCEKAKSYAASTGRDAELNLYFEIANQGPRLFQEKKGKDKVISPNVDFFSGFVYDCMGIPHTLFTPLFAMARTCGWCAHRIEEILSGKRIIRPKYGYVALD